VLLIQGKGSTTGGYRVWASSLGLSPFSVDISKINGLGSCYMRPGWAMSRLVTSKDLRTLQGPLEDGDPVIRRA
jgi:hypothetical protein